MIADVVLLRENNHQAMILFISSVIEFFGKILFVIVFIPRFKDMAVIFCEPAIWIVMAIYLLWAFWRTPFVRSGKTVQA